MSYSTQGPVQIFSVQFPNIYPLILSVLILVLISNVSDFFFVLISSATSLFKYSVLFLKCLVFCMFVFLNPSSLCGIV